MSTNSEENESTKEPISNCSSGGSTFAKVFSLVVTIVGLLFAIVCGGIFTRYMYELHETKLWFSNIRQVEQEISLRTEAGLYYSYYKDAVSKDAPVSELLYDLQHDRRTEYPREINILERFNVYQELLLALLYKFLQRIPWLTEQLPAPMIFYVVSCFALSGFGVSALFCLTWKLTKSWVFGLLVFAWMTVNYEDSVRVFFTVNLRENFALPVFWLQNLCAVAVIQRRSERSKFYSSLFVMTTFLFALFWQFSQFILVLQSVAIFALGMQWPELETQVARLLTLQCVGFLAAAVALFMQPMMLVSLLVSFDAAAIAVLFNHRLLRSISLLRNSASYAIKKFLLVLLLTLIFSTSVKFISGVKSDTHIWTFVKAKIGILSRSQVPFETALYLCHGAFAFLDRAFFHRATKSGCFPLYIVAVTSITFLAVYFFVERIYSKRLKGLLPSAVTATFVSPEALFLISQSVLSGIVALFTLRMKYLWFPQIAVVSASFLAMLSKFIGRLSAQFLSIAITVALLGGHYGVYLRQLENEEEFYDPDTVELMEWISSSTDSSSSWSGSMQLMAGVKACTGRNLANHPHFEDKWLRERTARLYQTYGRRSAVEVHSILRSEQVDYIILEDSICLAPSTGCSTNDLVDIENGDTTDFENLQLDEEPSESGSRLPRFCEHIKYSDEPDMKRLFKLVFENHTFRVYRVLRV